MNNIVLKEYQDSCVELSDEDRDFLIKSSILKDKDNNNKIKIERHHTTDQYIINPQQYVGIIALPSNKQIVVKPKVPIQNLFYMISVSLGFKDFDFDYDKKAFLDEEIEIYELITRMFLKEAEVILRSGLHRKYVEAQDNLNVVRGRINFNEDLKFNLIMRNRIFCEFEELTLNIAENQVIYQATKILSRRSIFKDIKIKDQLNTLLQRLSILDENNSVNYKSNIIDKFVYDKMTDRYRPIHSLCKFILDNSSFSDDVGENQAQAFMIDMNILFEKFITHILIEGLDNKFQVKDQYNLYLDKSNKYKMIPDIVISEKKTNKEIIVADCKYKRLTKDARSSNSDIYQLISYCNVTNTHNGVLIYPKDESLGDSFEVINSSIKINQIVMDLNTEINQLKIESENLCQKLLDSFYIEKFEYEEITK